MYKITRIHLFYFAEMKQLDEIDFEYERWYNANVVINDEFIFQVGCVGNEANISIPYSEEVYWIDKREQDEAADNIDPIELEKILEESQGFENNIFWLEDSPFTEISVQKMHN